MGPQFIRTLLDAKPRDYGYTVVEYNLVNGTFKQHEIKVGDTEMRIEVDGQQFETCLYEWQLCPKNVWMNDFDTFLEARRLNKYTGEFPMPAY